MERSIQYIKRYYGTRLPGIYDSVSPLLVCFFFSVSHSSLFSWFLSHFGYFDEVSFDHWIYFFYLGREGGREGWGGGGGRGGAGVAGGTGG